MCIYIIYTHTHTYSMCVCRSIYLPIFLPIWHLQQDKGNALEGLTQPPFYHSSSLKCTTVSACNTTNLFACFLPFHQCLPPCAQHQFCETCPYCCRSYRLSVLTVCYSDSQDVSLDHQYQLHRKLLEVKFSEAILEPLL